MDNSKEKEFLVLMYDEMGDERVNSFLECDRESCKLGWEKQGYNVSTSPEGNLVLRYPGPSWTDEYGSEYGEGLWHRIYGEKIRENLYM